MEKPEEARYYIFTGNNDENNMPHGEGTKIYYSEKRPVYKYTGMFIHGVRHGKGEFYWYAPYYNHKNPIDESAWYRMGEYDNKGRLVGPKHAPDSWEPFCRFWDLVYDGMWENDLPVDDKENEMCKITMKKTV